MPPFNARIERANGNFLDVWDDESIFIKRKQKIIKGKYLYAGPLFPHYGHVMTESIHRLYGYDKNLHDGVVFTACWFSPSGVEKITIPKYLSSVLSLFDIDIASCIVVTENTLFENVDFFSPGSSLQNGPTSIYLDYLESNINLELENKNEYENQMDKIFLGRRHIFSQGSVMGESYIANKLLESNFEYFAPELFDLKTQISILKSAKEIVFVEGSAIYASELIGKWNANVYMIPRRNFDSYFRPHIEKRTKYSTVGDMNSLIRLNNSEGKIKPNSPTIYSNPESINSDLVKFGLINNVDFDNALFKKHEYLDLLSYSGGGSIVHILEQYSTLKGEGL